MLALCVFGATWAGAAAPPQTIDTGASCTATCHLELGKKAEVHKAARKGTECNKCHEPTAADRHVFKPQPEKIAKQCLSCHDDLEVAEKVQHKPFRSGKCLDCHDPHESAHKMLLKKPVLALCMECHDDIDLESNVVHGPVGEGKCLECHAQHQSEMPKLLTMPTLEMCFSCHDAVLKDAKGRPLPATKKLFDDKRALKHEPFAEGKCSKCHQPHVSDSRRLLMDGYPSGFYAKFSADAYGLCFDCHPKKAFDEPRTLVESDFRNGNLNLHYRHVNRDKGRSCGACHAPHGSTQPKMMADAIRFGNKILSLIYEKTDTGGTCTSACHAPVRYDRCAPVPSTMKTTARVGSDATADALKLACDRPAPKSAGKDAGKGADESAAKTPTAAKAPVPQKAKP